MAGSQSRPTFKFIAPICACTGGAVVFPWSKGFDYDPDSVQYTPNFALHAASFGLQEFLKLLEFRDQLFEFVNGIGSQLGDRGADSFGISPYFRIHDLSGF